MGLMCHVGTCHMVGQATELELGDVRLPVTWALPGVGYDDVCRTLNVCRTALYSF